jgi:hypothetical protein
LRSALGLVALLTAGTASAEAADAQFLDALQQQGIGFGDTQSAITVAHHTCDAPYRLARCPSAGRPTICIRRP